MSGTDEVLPSGWLWADAGQLAHVTGGITKNSSRSSFPIHVPYIRVANVYANTKGQQYFLDEGKQTTNLASISLSKLRGLAVPIPSTAEQHRMEVEIDRRLSIVDDTEHEVAGGLKRIHRLRQSILKWAFEGRLVDQDPDDEPASVLLERIKAERVAKEAKKKRKRGRTAPTNRH